MKYQLNNKEFLWENQPDRYLVIKQTKRLRKETSKVTK